MCHRATERLKTSHNMRMLCIVLVGVYITFPGLLAWADTVYLKDGRILRDCRATKNNNIWAIEKGGATINLPAASVQKVDKSETRSAEAASEDKATAETTSTQDNTAATGRDLHYDYKLAEDLESMVVPDEMYPDGKCKIWVPTEKARNEYINKTIFVPSSVAKEGRKFASVDDVVRDKSQFGYFFSTLPPQFVPVIDYPTGDQPIFSFVGQKVPGTDIGLKGTSERIDPAWLVDIATIDGKEVTVPALTTIDFHNFRQNWQQSGSINWPRERYLSAIEKARNGKADTTIAGQQRQSRRTLSGIVRVTGDYQVSKNQTLSIAPGTIFVIDANSDSAKLEPKFTDTERFELIVRGNLSCKGTEYRPIIFTSGAETPMAADWNQIKLMGQGLPINIEGVIAEYGITQILAKGDGRSYNIVRSITRNDLVSYRQTKSEQKIANGIYCGIRFGDNTKNCIIDNTEGHGNVSQIACDLGSNKLLITHNICYGSKKGLTKKTWKRNVYRKF